MSACFLTITVLTYNSEKYVLETLESISKQARKDIQIVISDDCSEDKTVDIIKEWISENDSKFMEVTLLTAIENQGVVKNKQKTFSYIKGHYLKGLAGDDKLAENAIEYIKKDISNFPESEIILGKVNWFGENINPNTIIIRNEITQKLDSINHQIEYLLNGYHYPAIGFLYKTSFITQAGLFDERFKNMEDIGLHLRFLTEKKQIQFSDNIYVFYRKHNKNLSTLKSNEVLSAIQIDYLNVILEFSKKYGKRKYILNTKWNLFLSKLIFRFGNKGFLCKQINKIRTTFQPKKIYNLFSNE